MKRYVHAICAMLAVVLCLTSCLRDNDDTDLSSYGDTAITSFALSSVNRYRTAITAAGEDSVYKTTITSSLPVFTIDHYGQKIYNTEPLPTGCDLAHVIASIGSKNSGTIVLKSLTSDTLTVFSSSDSVDFSKPRELRVYALNGSGYRAYEVTVNMRTTEPDLMEWTAVAAGTDGIPTALYEEPVAVQADEVADGEDASLLPTSDFARVEFADPSSANTVYELLVGSTDNYAKASVVWRRITELGWTAKGWVYMPLDDHNSYYLPKMQHLSLVWFEGRVLAIGNNGKIYESRDQGITWKPSTKITFPDDLDSQNLKAAADTEGNLWIRSLDSERVWKGWLTE